jgi:hypothetical protein
MDLQEVHSVRLAAKSGFACRSQIAKEGEPWIGNG